MPNALSIPTEPKVNPLSIPSASAPKALVPATTKSKTPFAATRLGIGVNTVTGLPAAAWQVGKDIVQGTARDTIGLGRTFANIVAPGSEPETETQTGALKKLLGDQPIRTIPSQFHEAKTDIENSPIAQKIGASKFAGPIAFGSVLGNNILDFTPMGGTEDAAVKILAKETDPEIIRASLEKIGIHPSVAEKFAPHFAETNDPKEVKTLLKTVKGVQMLKHTAEAHESLHEPDLTYEPTDEESMAQTARTATQAPVEGSIDEDALQEFNKSQPTAPDESNTNIPTHLEPLAERAREAGSPEAFKQNISDLQDKYIRGDTLTPEDTNVLKGLKDAKADHIGTAEDFYKRAVPKTPIEVKPSEGELLDNKIADLETQHEIMKDALDNHPGKGLVKYRSSATGELPEIATGAKSKFGARGDVIGQDALGQEMSGGGDIDALNEHLKSYLDLRDQTKETEGELKSLKERRSEIPEKAADGFYNRSLDQRDGDIPTKIENPREESNTDAPSSGGNTGKMDPTIEEQFARRQAGTPGNTIQALAKESDAKSWQSLVTGFSRNLPRQEKAHLLDYMGTPEFVLEKLGLQKGAEMLQDAKDLYHSNLKKEIAKVVGWEKEVRGTPDSARRIFKYLDGQAKEVRHEMTDTEYRVAQEIKAYLKDWAKRLDLPEDKQISNYITHIFEKGAISLDDKVDPFADPDLAAIMEAQPAKSVYDPFLEKRVNKQGYRQDVWAALDAYTKRATRKEAMDPALEKIAAQASHLEGDAYEYVAALTHNVNMRPTKIDGLIDNLITKFAGTKFTDRPTAYLTSKFRNLFYRGSLGLNLASALRNLSQGANTYAKLGERYTLTGYTKVMTNLATNNMAELYEHGILDDAIIQDRRIGVYKNILQRLDPILYKMFDTAEKINRGAAYWGAKAKALDKGLPEDQAIKYAKRMVRETQFSFSAVDSAVALGGDAVKTALQLQNYNIKQIEFFSRMLQNKEYAGLARWTVASLGFVYSIGRAFGMTPAQLIPGVGIGGGSGSPMLNMIDGLVHLGDSNSQKRASAQTELENTAIQAIPAGTQIKKTSQGLQVYGAGKDVTTAGNTRYKVPRDPRHLIQAALFGKSALPEAQQYYKKLDNPKANKLKKNPLSV